MININGLDKAAVLAALHNGTRPLGMSFLHDIGRDMTVDEAQQVISAGRGVLYFDYVCGRPIKCDLSGSEFSPRLYDRDAGEGQAARVIQQLRDSVGKAA